MQKRDNLPPIKKMIYVNEETHAKLNRIKAHYRLRFFDDAINFVIKKADAELTDI